MNYTLGEAAKATGKTKPTILRAIQAHKISAKKNEHGQWQIDPAELHRLYEPIREEQSETQRGNDTLQVEVTFLRELVADLREDRDRWRTQAEKLLLTDQRAQTIITPPPMPAAEAPVKRRWWQRG
jgi:hypothetical protein